MQGKDCSSCSKNAFLTFTGLVYFDCSLGNGLLVRTQLYSVLRYNRSWISCTLFSDIKGQDWSLALVWQYHILGRYILYLSGWKRINFFCVFVQVATSHGLGVFWKLLVRWKGSIYKLVWQNLVVYLALYSSLSLMYRFLLGEEARVS